MIAHIIKTHGKTLSTCRALQCVDSKILLFNTVEDERQIYVSNNGTYNKSQPKSLCHFVNIRKKVNEDGIV